jgi:hypothetical protein
MGAVNALDRLQSFAEANPDLGLDRSADVLRSGPASVSNFDYDRAIALARTFPVLLRISAGPRTQRLRDIALALVLQLDPPWKWLISLGRRHLSQYLPDDARQVFDSAGLYGDSDDPTIRCWWDGLSQSVRAASNEANLGIGRAGEDLTLAHERRILMLAGRHDLRPEHVGFEDTTLGYDVNSFILADTAVQPKYIEVKATEAKPLRFSFTRNQWVAAERHASSYFVHIWHLPSQELTEISFAELATTIPQDRGRGKWDTTVVTWD